MNMKLLKLRIKLFSARFSAQVKGLLFKVTPNLSARGEDEAPPAPYIVHMGMGTGTESDVLGRPDAQMTAKEEAQAKAMKEAATKSRKAAQASGELNLPWAGSPRGSAALQAGLSGKPRAPEEIAPKTPAKPRSAALPVGIPMGQPQQPTIGDMLSGLDTSLASGGSKTTKSSGQTWSPTPKAPR